LRPLWAYRISSFPSSALAISRDIWQKKENKNRKVVSESVKEYFTCSIEMVHAPG